MGTSFFRFQKYLYMVCLKMAHLWRVTYCFETLLFLCKLVFFNYNFHKNTRSRQKRFLSKQGQPRPLTRLKARLLTGQLKNGLFLRLRAELRETSSLHYSVHYYRVAILPIVILTLFVNMFFLRKLAQYPSSLIFILPASVLSYIDSKQTKRINSITFVNSGFATGRSPVQIWLESFYFFLFLRQISTKLE